MKLRAAARRPGGAFPFTSTLGPTAKFVSPNATGSGDGTFFIPWTINQAIIQAAPGDVIWLRGGNYDSTSETICFNFATPGTSTNRITWRSYPGERAWLRYVGPEPGKAGGQPVVSLGAYNTLRDVRVCAVWGSVNRYFGPDINSSRREGIILNGAAARLVNSFNHDTCSGPGSFDAGVGSLTYGNVILNFGYTDDNRGHGHGVYQQNAASGASNRKVIRHNITAYGYGSGIKTAGDQASITGLRVEQNIIHRPNCHWEVGGGSGTGIWELYSHIGITDTAFNGNVAYGPHVEGSCGPGMIAKAFVGAIPYSDIEVQKNLLVCGTGGWEDMFAFYSSLLFAYNTVSVLDTTFNAYHARFDPTLWAANTAFVVNQTRSYLGQMYICIADHTSTTTFDPTKWAAWSPSVYTMHDNHYYGGFNGHNGSNGGFAIINGTHVGLPAWQAMFGEANSTSSPSTETPAVRPLAPDEKRVFANAYEAGRAHIGVWNANALASTVIVPMVDWETGAPILSAGDPYYVWSAVNPDQGIIAQGTYDGVGIPIPMTTDVVGMPAVPDGSRNFTGKWDYTPPTTLPDFGSFVVRKCPYAPGYGAPKELTTTV